MTWLWISLSFATFGIAVRDGRVVDAPPIARWTMNKSEEYVVRYYRKRGATIRPL